MKKKRVVASEPWLEQKEASRHELSAYKAWRSLGGATCSHKQPHRIFDRFVYHYQFPHVWMDKSDARLVFVSGWTPLYLAFPDYICHEIIPLFWDCWPGCYERVQTFIKNNNVKAAYFTSSQAAKQMQDFFPHLHIGYIPEGIDPLLYYEGDNLINRSIDLLEYGRSNVVDVSGLSKSYNHLKSNGKERLFPTNRDFYQALSNTKITFCFPRSVTHPWQAGNMETLTQRYWECMLSRIVMLGKAPKELIDIVGYNPVVEVDYGHPVEQIERILTHIEDYQDFVDKNRESAVKYGDWKSRMSTLMNDLAAIGYIVK